MRHVDPYNRGTDSLSDPLNPASECLLPAYAGHRPLYTRENILLLADGDKHACVPPQVEIHMVQRNGRGPMPDAQMQAAASTYAAAEVRDIEDEVGELDGPSREAVLRAIRQEWLRRARQDQAIEALCTEAEEQCDVYVCQTCGDEFHTSEQQRVGRCPHDDGQLEMNDDAEVNDKEWLIAQLRALRKTEVPRDA